MPAVILAVIGLLSAVMAGLIVAAILGALALARDRARTLLRRRDHARHEPRMGLVAEPEPYRLTGRDRDELRDQIAAVEQLAQDPGGDEVLVIGASSWWLQVHGQDRHARYLREALLVTNREERITHALRGMREVLVNETPPGFHEDLTPTEALERWFEGDGTPEEKRAAIRERTKSYAAQVSDRT